MRRFAAVLGAAALTLALSACSGTETKATAGNADDAVETTTDTAAELGGNEVRVATWLQSAVEGQALDALLMVFDKDGEDYRFVNVGSGAGGGGADARKKIREDIESKNPPDTYQLHAGEEAADDIKAGYLEPLDDLFEQYGLARAFPASLISELKVGGKIYSLPFNVHRANVVWANPAVLNAAGVSTAPPSNLDAWLADMAQVKAAGKTPLILGEGWTQAHLFESVLIADLGAEGYSGLFDGKTSWEDPRIQQAISHFTQLLSYSNADKADLSWEDGANKIINGEGAYYVMGDWAYGSFSRDGRELGKEYIAYPVPGTDGVFDFLADSFTKPVGAKNPKGSDLWLKVGTSVDGQVAFNKIKGSIPARSDIPAERLAEFSSYQQEAMKSFAHDQIVSSYTHGIALPPTELGELVEIITKYSGGNSSAEGFAQELAAFGNKLSAK